MSDREWIIHRDVVDHTPMVDSVRFVPEQLSGDLTFQMSNQHANAFTRDEVVVLAEQTLSPAVRYAGAVMVTQQMLDDAPVMENFLAHAFDRALRPWKFPDRRGWPTSFDLFPGLHRAATRVQRLAREARLRPRAAWAVLRHGEPERDEDDW